MNTFIINGVQHETKLNTIGFSAIVFLADKEIEDTCNVRLVDNSFYPIKESMILEYDIVRLDSTIVVFHVS